MNPTGTSYIHFPASMRHKKHLLASTHCLRGGRVTCIWAENSWLHTLGDQAKPLCCGMPSSSRPALEPSWAWENRSGYNMGSRKQLSALLARLKHLQMPTAHAIRSPPMLPWGAHQGKEAHGCDAGQGPAAGAPRLAEGPACFHSSHPLPSPLPGSRFSNSTSVGLGFYSSTATYERAPGDISFSKAKEETSSINH